MDIDRMSAFTNIEKERWWNKNYSFFRNEACEYFPCHKTGKKEDFNCLFCYCPLYPLQDRCGGNFTYFGNIKDCSGCTLPHQKRSYGYITSRFGEIAAIARGESVPSENGIGRKSEIKK